MKKVSGFTLIELLIVMVILAMLAAIVGPSLFNALGKGRTTTALSQMDNIKTSLDQYRLDVGRYPQTLEGLTKNDSGRESWNGPYLRGELPKDPWGNDYQYSPGDKDISLISLGADGAPGGEGDDADIGK